MIEINNLTKTRIDERYLKRAASAALEEIKKEKAEVSLALVGDKRMRALNKMYRGKDATTDVLSFSQLEGKGRFIKAPENGLNLGDIVISVPTAKKQAKRAGHPLKKELTALLIHGILHLAGHHHERGGGEEERAKSLQNRILKKISNS